MCSSGSDAYSSVAGNAEIGVAVVVGLTEVGTARGGHLFNHNTDDNGIKHDGQDHRQYVEHESNSTLSSGTLLVTMEIIILCLYKGNALTHLRLHT